VNGSSETPPPASLAAEDPGAPIDPAVVPPPPPGEPVPGLPPIGQTAGAGAGDRPEVAVGAAFAGGFVLAMILKRLGR